MERHSYEVDGLPHRSPIPAASSVGPMVWSSPVYPIDVATGKTPSDIETQCKNVFANIALVAQAAGITMDHIGKIEIWMGDLRDRDALNDEWRANFPDSRRRPARQVQHSTSLPPGIRLMATFQAWAGEPASVPEAEA